MVQSPSDWNRIISIFNVVGNKFDKALSMDLPNLYHTKIEKLQMSCNFK